MKTLFYLFVVVTGIYGYYRNLVHISECDFKPSYRAEVVYIALAFTPVSCVVGYFDLSEYLGH